ncbi:MAG: prepilin-type N-terminal cleavage/methylation domain-containing protein [Nitrospirae bacterium]|nr:prepilin-type N-terminal cleavage/methylation domain-containing protein [Nitrospirota bacterium]
MLFFYESLRKDRDSGFTLIELMLAMVLLTIVLGAVYSSFFVSEKALNGLDESLLKMQECRKAIDILGRETESIFYNISDKNCIVRVDDRDFYGKQASRFSFTAYSPMVQGLAAISYYVEEKDGKLTLYKKIRSYLKPDDSSPGVEIIEGVDSFMVEALSNAKWTKTWDASATATVPDQVRITITILTRDRPVTLYETVTPMIGKNL